jgi:pSer/pThr/pTyr-binding forkhead associated (FHA) protein
MSEEGAGGLWVGSRKILLGEGTHVIGRDPTSAVWLDVPEVSRRHACVAIDRNGASIADLQSKNGTTVREQVVTGTAVLHDGDRIQVGPVLMVFHPSSSGFSTATVTGRTSLPPESRKFSKSSIRR